MNILQSLTLLVFLLLAGCQTSPIKDMDVHTKLAPTLSSAIEKQFDFLTLRLEHQRFIAEGKDDLFMSDAVEPVDTLFYESEGRPAGEFKFENIYYKGDNRLTGHIALDYTRLTTDFDMANRGRWTFIASAGLLKHNTRLRVTDADGHSKTNHTNRFGYSYGYKIQYHFMPELYLQNSLILNSLLDKDDIGGSRFNISLNSQLHDNFLLSLEHGYYAYNHDSDQGSKLLIDLQFTGLGLTVLL